MKLPETNELCSKYFKYSDFIECSDTFKKTKVFNTPSNILTYNAIKYFAEEILDKVKDHFGNLIITYGFCGNELKKEIKKNIYPKTDQHSGFEKNSKGELICQRMGFASDFKVNNLSSLTLAQWVVKNCKFDRLYFYGEDRPIHVSTNQIPTQKIVLMKFYNIRRVPQNISKEKFLKMENFLSHKI